MSRILRALGIVAICGGLVAAGVTILRANDRAKAEQQARSQAALAALRNMGPAGTTLALAEEAIERAEQAPGDLPAGATHDAGAAPEADAKVESELNPGGGPPVIVYDEFADLVERFNKLMALKQFPKAELVARRARHLQPKNPVSEAMLLKVRLALQDAANEKSRATAGRNSGSDSDARSESIAEVRIEGNKTIPADQILQRMKTRAGAALELRQLKEDVRALHDTRWFFRVEPHVVHTDKGLTIRIVVVERPDAASAKPEEPAVSPDGSEASATGDVVFDDVREFNVQVEDPRTRRLMFGVGEGAVIRVPDVNDMRLQEASNLEYISQWVTDRGQREALTRIIEKLKAEAADLDNAGLKDDAAQKRVAVEGLDKALQNVPTPEMTYYLRDGELHRRPLPGERAKIKALLADLARTGEEIQKLRVRREQITGKKAAADGDVPADVGAIDREIEGNRKKLEKSQTELGDAISHQRDELKRHLEYGNDEAAAAKRGLIELLVQTHKLAGEMKEGLPADYHSRFFPHWFPAGPESKLKRQVEALEEYKARQQGQLDIGLPFKEASLRDAQSCLDCHARDKQDLGPRLESCPAVRDLKDLEKSREREILELKKQIEERYLQSAELQNNGRLVEAEGAQKKAGELKARLQELTPAYRELRQKRALMEAEAFVNNLNAEHVARHRKEADNRDSAILPGAAAIVARLQNMLQRWRALEGAAAALKKGGLEDQAREMSEASDQVRKEFFQMRESLARDRMISRTPSGSSDTGLKPAVELAEVHRTLTELREQVQELRKEVGQVRELLEKKP